MIKENNIRYFTLEDFEVILNQIIETGEEFAEDIPSFQTRYPGKLESILEQIKAEYFGVELYETIEKKAAWLFYSIIKNHPLSNGNKRMAVVIYMSFLLKNKGEIYLDQEILDQELYEMTLITAASSPDDKEEILDMLEIKTKQYIEF